MSWTLITAGGGSLDQDSEGGAHDAAGGGSLDQVSEGGAHEAAGGGSWDQVSEGGAHEAHESHVCEGDAQCHVPDHHHCVCCCAPGK